MSDMGTEARNFRESEVRWKLLHNGNINYCRVPPVVTSHQIISQSTRRTMALPRAQSARADFVVRQDEVPHSRI